MQQFRLGTNWLESSFAGMGWQILVHKKDVKYETAMFISGVPKARMGNNIAGV